MAATTCMVRTCLLLQVCLYCLVASCSYLMNYSNSNLFTFLCTYADDYRRVISRLVTSWLKWVNYQ
jgi:hypothetical protein